MTIIVNAISSGRMEGGRVRNFEDQSLANQPNQAAPYLLLNLQKRFCLHVCLITFDIVYLLKGRDLNIYEPLSLHKQNINRFFNSVM